MTERTHNKEYTNTDFFNEMETLGLVRVPVDVSGGIDAVDGVSAMYFSPDVVGVPKMTAFYAAGMLSFIIYVPKHLYNESMNTKEYVFTVVSNLLSTKSLEKFLNKYVIDSVNVYDDSLYEGMLTIEANLKAV